MEAVRGGRGDPAWLEFRAPLRLCVDSDPSLNLWILGPRLCGMGEGGTQVRLCEAPRGHSHQPRGHDSHALAPEGRAKGRIRVAVSQQMETPSLEGEKENVNSPRVTHSFIIQSTTTTGPHTRSRNRLAPSRVLEYPSSHVPVRPNPAWASKPSSP